MWFNIKDVERGGFVIGKGMQLIKLGARNK